MFIDERTLCNINANLDESVIHGTLRTCDLVPAFIEVIRETAEYEELFYCHSNSEIVRFLTDPSVTDSDEFWYSEDMIYFLNETLIEILNDYTPEGYYFGSHIGDGSDFGYWKFDE